MSCIDPDTASCGALSFAYTFKGNNGFHLIYIHLRQH